MSSARKKPKKTKTNPKSKPTSRTLLAAIILFFFVMIYWNLSYRSIHHDLTRINNINEWLIMYGDNSTTYQFSNQGLQVKTSNDVHIIPPIIADDTTWEDLPYVTVEFEPANTQRDLSLSWFLADTENDFYARPQVIAAGATQAYFNTQDELLTFKIDDWNSSYQNEGRIKKYSIQFKTDFVIKSITLSNRLSVMNQIDLIFTNFFITHDRITSYSINFIKGVIVGQSRLILWLGLIVFAAAVYFTLTKQPKRIFVILLITFAIYDLNFNINLVRLASYGLPLSAFHKSEYDEFNSRFGQEFADLNQTLKNLVPKGSKVLFPNSVAYPYRGERGWVAPLYAGFYDYISPNPEYIMIFYPSEGKFGRDTNNRPAVKLGETVYIVENIHFVSDELRIAKILEVQ